MKHSKLFKYIFISTLATLAIFSTACNKKSAPKSAAEINESIAQANKEKAEAEEKALEESKAQQAETDEKFRIKSEDEKLEESRQAVIESEAPALKEEALKTVDTLYAVDSDDPDKIKQAKEEAKQKIEEGFENLTPESDVYVQMAEATDIDSDEVINLAELDDYSWNRIATNILFSVTPEFGYTGYYKNLNDVYIDIDKTYANYSESIREQYKQLADKVWTESIENNKLRAQDPNPWTLEELQEDDSRFLFSREEYEGSGAYAENNNDLFS